MSTTTKADVARLLECEIADRLVSHLTESDLRIRLRGARFRLAYTDETPGLDDEAIVLIDPGSGDLFEVEIGGVSVRRIELPGPAAEPVDPNQLSLLPNLAPEGAA